MNLSHGSVQLVSCGGIAFQFSVALEINPLVAPSII